MSNHQQLSLDIIPRLTYSADSFLLHSGVEAIVQEITASFKNPAFQIHKVLGSSRFGKTHLSLYLADYAYRNILFPRVVDGSNFGSWMTDRLERSQIDSDEIIIVDEAEAYLATLKPGDSGPFVNFIEACRVKGATVVLLIDEPSEAQFSYDEHVASRILAGIHHKMGAPNEEDLLKLTELLTKQRGMYLSVRKRSYLTKRLPRDIPSLERYLEKLERLATLKGSSVKFPLLSEAL